MVQVGHSALIMIRVLMKNTVIIQASKTANVTTMENVNNDAFHIQQLVRSKVCALNMFGTNLAITNASKFEMFTQQVPGMNTMPGMKPVEPVSTHTHEMIFAQLNAVMRTQEGGTKG